jgi:5'-deoxynucleotidase YfbR-like HD superfamily hydrolase
MLAMQSGKIWDSDDSPDKYMSNVTTIALLHDFVEAEIDGYKQQHTNTRPSELLKKRDEVLNRIRRKFGGVVAKGVAAITSPPDIEDTEIRRDVYAATIRSDDYARIVKPADRWQNHITDIVELAFAQLGPDERRRKLAYFAKTDRHLSADFISDDMPEVYRRAHRIMWEYARHFGYEQVA